MKTKTLEPITLTIAMFSYISYDGTLNNPELGDMAGYRANDRDYIQVTEPLTITFEPKKADVILSSQVESINSKIDKVRDNATKDMEVLNRTKQELLAITFDGVQS